MEKQYSNVNFNKEKVSEYRKKAEELVSKMTLKEKCLQTLHRAPGVERLNVKSYNYWNEALHGVARAGVATVFPQAVTLAASFDEDLMEEIGSAISDEARAKYNNQQKFGDHDIYKGLTFWAPNINIFRDPRWGRGHETYGEDPYLTSRLGTRFIEGIQGRDGENLKAAACTKHFAVHSGPEDIRHSFDAVVNKKDLYETYLYAFKECIKNTKVETVMGAYNRVNGEPCCGSKTLLKDILRDEFGFEGHVTSDCWAIQDFYKGHMVCDTPLEAVALAMNNGCDLNCGNLFENLEEAVKQGLVSEERVNEAVVNLLTTRFKLGIMEGQKTKYDSLSIKDCDTKEKRELNLKAALSSMVLLKNENNTLPLKKGSIKTLGVVGPNADNRRALVGNYEGTSSRYETILLGLQDYLKDDVRILYSAGCHLFKDRVEGLAEANDRLAEAKGVYEASDVIVCVVGLDSGLEGEEGDQGNAYASGDKKDLELPGLQNELLNAAFDTGKPVVVVLLSGSALNLKTAKEKAAAIVYAGYPGAMGGTAVAKLLFGEENFSGHLPVTFYNSADELPSFTDYSMKGRTYRYFKGNAQFPFGFGLSYSEFRLSDTASVKKDKDAFIAEAEVENVNGPDGAALLQVYVETGEENAPIMELKGFKKVSVPKGQKVKVSVALSNDAFTLVGEDGKRYPVKDNVKVHIGLSQPDRESVRLLKTKPVTAVINF